MSGAEEHGEGLEDDDVRLPYFYVGMVVDDNDPEEMGRVRVKIEAVIEKSRWAYPIGTVGGGKTRRGFFNVPEVGSTVGVFFNQGDPDHPHYIAGHWGNQVEGASDEGEDGTQLPERARLPDVPAEAKKKVRVFETERWALVFDDRETPKNDDGDPIDDGVNGQDTFLILHKESGQTIEVDGGRRGITIQATALLNIDARGLVNIGENALIVQIAGRKVMRTGGNIG